MTDQLAKQILEALIEEIRRNGLTDIFTFMIPERPAKQRFKDFDGYRPTSTSGVMDEFLFRSGDNPRASLFTLLNAATDYFFTANAIPGRYRELLSGLAPGRDINADIRITTLSGEHVNLSETITSATTTSILDLLKFIETNIDLPDDEFQQRLQAYLNEAS